jgi:hypothetical protein
MPLADEQAESPETSAEEAKEGWELPLGASETALEESAPSDDLGAVHTEALGRYEQAWHKDRHNQKEAYDDLDFLGNELGQWDARALQERQTQNRPVLTVNKVPQFVRQITGDIRQLRPAIHVVPVNESAADMIATTVLPEMVRYIERRSDAKAAYFHGADQMAAAGIGHARVFTEYAAGSTFNQEIKIGLVQDGIAVLWDPDAIEPTRKDALYCFVPVDMNRKRAEKIWPGRAFDYPMSRVNEAYDGWSSDEFVRVCEYWRKVAMVRELAIYPDGKIIDLTDDSYAEQALGTDYAPDATDEDENKPSKDEANYRAAEGANRCANCMHFTAPNQCAMIQGPVRGDMLCDYFEPLLQTLFAPQPLGQMGATGPMGMPLMLGPNMGPKRADALAAGARIEKRESYKVERFIISAGEVLEGPDEWPGMHIPIVPFIGEEVQIGRRTVRRGIVRVLKDVQRLYNYAISADAEAVALQPKAPFIGTVKNFQDFQDQWETANSKNWPFLEFTPDPENGGVAPMRSPPPVASTGIKDLLAISTGDMSGVTGIYPPSLGQQSNETSGKAITARQREGDTGTFHYIEAFGRAIERIGQIVVDLIPHIYDTERTLRVIGDDGRMTKLDINKEIVDPNGDGIATTMFNDVTVGAYQVSVEMGPSYSTKREEARDGMQTLLQALGPQVAPVIADLYVQGQDFPLADKIAKRMRAMLPPPLAALEAADAGEPPPPPQPPPQPSPQDLAKMQQMQQENALEAAKVEVANKQIQAELIKINASLEEARMTHQANMAKHAATAGQAYMDVAENAHGRAHDLVMAQVNGGAGGNGGAAPVQTRSDPEQQMQINALIGAVSQLKDVVMQIADVIGSPSPPPSAPPTAAMPPGPPPVPPAPVAPPGAPPRPIT